MQYLIGMLATFVGITIIFTAANFFSRKDKGSYSELLEQHKISNAQGLRRAVALERIADCLDKKVTP
jgi:hypothetical protein